MMLQTNKKIIVSLLIIMILLANVQTVHAFYYLINYNFAGITDATALKDVWVVNSTSWNGHIRSYTVRPDYNIDIIGWTWWIIRDKCDGILIDSYTYGGYVEYNDAYVFDTAVDDRDTCGGSYRGYSLGTHDFKESGNTWRPYFSTDESI